ncbi:fungal-specific transcription factor domain-containing protein [Xylariaceae sp. AK1471]|nr:fungal-specific transcription factor domain-containing protein [Xylariaceae sp. AK1471]
MNGVKIRSSQGCWTCRLRRKKCDEERPICVTCMGLEIDCHYSDTKPEWLDGGAREKQMADELKVMVKQKAAARRERRWAQLPTMEDFSPSTQTQRNQSLDHLMRDVGDPTPGDDGAGNGNRNGNSPSTIPSISETSPSREAETNPSSNPSSPPTSSSCEGVPVPVSPAVQPTVDSFPEDKSEMEVTFTMVYLDYVVPFLFPFYRPCLLVSSRGWMLVLLMKNRALFHTALSLAGWLYAVVLNIADASHGACKRANWAELQDQQEIAIKALQEDIQALNERGGVANAPLKEGVACMQSIIQLLEFEVVMANTSSWQWHHDAAVALFDQSITHHATANSKTPWSSILDRIGSSLRCSPINIGRGIQILTSDQSAYKFYTAYLLFIDIVAATANGEAPRLRKYHAELLDDDSDASPVICLNEYIGCQSWAMMEIAEVANLAAWKRAQQGSGSLSMIDLVRQACAIDKRLRQKIEALESSFPIDHASSNANTNIYDPSAHPPVTPYTGFREMTAGFGFGFDQTSPAVALHTRIWAHATITYLHVVASGLQSTLPEIRASVSATISLFRTMPSPLALRTLVWPFAVTGCLALPEQESFFVELVEGMGAMQVFGTVKEALDIMQNVWKHRNGGCIDPQMWDMATCFSLLGHCSLLV